MSLEQIRKNLLKSESFRKEYCSNCNLALEVAEVVRRERINQQITQKELAFILNTKQSSIARLERGLTLPSLEFLNRIAKALNRELLPPRFAEPIDLEYRGGISWPVNKQEEIKKNSELTLIFNN